ncbi:MAG: histidine--tRNA ligase [Planctomycetes bacterium]|nr:histidine--tRNA ligase [Planctomycetota bacterium]
MALIEPRTLKGFRDYLPEQMIPRERLIETARRVYRSYGFLPIDTPALEYAEILTGKGGDESDKQLYRFQDHGGRDVALRFDLTVPLARFVAQYSNDLGLPFKRYHIASVWRGENTQRGRYREFMQCDFDTIGVEHIAADIEVGCVIHDLLRAIGFEEFRVRVNNRKLLTGVLEKLELAGKLVPVLRAIDKLDKLGADKVAEEIVREAQATPEQARAVLRFANLRESLPKDAGDDALIAALREHARGNERAEAGLAELATLVETSRKAGLPAERLQIDLSIARGLDYYTGTVFETVLGALPSIGSVCSGGRYDNLAQLYTKERLPGIGASLGLDRLLAAMEELGMVEKRRASASIFVPFFDAARLADYLTLCARLRKAGFGVEFFPEPKKLGAQLKYADRRGFKVALVLGEDEWKNGTCQVKDLAAQTARSVPQSALEHELALFRG